MKSDSEKKFMLKPDRKKELADSKAKLKMFKQEMARRDVSSKFKRSKKDSESSEVGIRKEIAQKTPNSYKK